MYDTKIMRWQHLNFFENECYIEARVPRVKDKNNKVHRIQVPWARSGIGFTLLFEAYSMLLIEQEMPMNKVAQTVRVKAPRIWRVFNYWIKIAIKKDRVSKVEQIGIDETSSKKGHNYVTVTVDMEERRVIHIGEGKESYAVNNMKEALETRGLQVENIKNVCIDMSPAYVSGVYDNFPNANIVFDKFHVKKILNESFYKVWQLERRENAMLKGHKYTFLKDYR